MIRVNLLQDRANKINNKNNIVTMIDTMLSAAAEEGKYEIYIEKTINIPKHIFEYYKKIGFDVTEATFGTYIKF